MPHPPMELIGTWRKIKAGPCDAQYPATLRIEANGLYAGHNPDSTFTIWDDGTVNQLSGDNIAVSTANDKIITYKYVLKGDTLTFTTPDNCSLTYEKIDKF